MAPDPLGRRSAGSVVQAEGPGGRTGDLARVGDRVQGDEPAAVGVVRRDSSPELDREAGLADPARAGDRQQPAGRQQLPRSAQVGLPADEAGQPAGQVAGRREAGPDRREFGGQSRDIRLEQLFRVWDVLEDVLAQVADRDPVRQAARDERPGGVGQDDLATMADGRDAGRAVDVEAAVVIARQVGLAAVEADPDPDGRAIRPRLTLDPALGVDGRGERPGRVGEGPEERVALGSDGDAAVPAGCVADDRQLAIIEGIPARPEGCHVAHRALDVGSQEGDGAGRQPLGGFGHRDSLAAGGAGSTGHCAEIRSASVASIAIAASGRSRRIAIRPSPLMTRPRTPGSSAMTVAARGCSRSRASSPMWSPGP